MGDVNLQEFKRTSMKPREIAHAITRGNSLAVHDDIDETYGRKMAV